LYNSVHTYLTGLTTQRCSYCEQPVFRRRLKTHLFTAAFGDNVTLFISLPSHIITATAYLYTAVIAYLTVNLPDHSQICIKASY